MIISMKLSYQNPDTQVLCIEPLSFIALANISAGVNPGSLAPARRQSVMANLQ